MALQDVCGFRDTPVYPRWNAPASLFMPAGDTSLHFGGGMAGRDFPLQLYAPVPEFLTKSPLEFGQVRPDNATPRQRPCTPSGLPSSLPLSPASLSLRSSCVPLPFPLSHGTTTLAFAFAGGIVAAADSRSSCQGLVACPASQKIVPVHSHLVGTTSGTSADCVLWKRILARELRLYRLRHRRRPSTGGAAKLLAHMLHPYKGTELCVAATLCGWDLGEESGGAERGGCCAEARETEGGAVSGEGEGQTEARGGGGGHACNDAVPTTRGQQSAAAADPRAGPRLYYVCSDGTLLQGELFSVGSGSPYAYSVLDGGVRWGMGVAEAFRLAREAVYRATRRDAYSGNCVDLYHVTAQGWRRREREDLMEEYYREREREREGEEERRRKRERERGRGRERGRERGGR